MTQCQARRGAARRIGRLGKKSPFICSGPSDVAPKVLPAAKQIDSVRNIIPKQHHYWTIPNDSLEKNPSDKIAQKQPSLFDTEANPILQVAR